MEIKVLYLPKYTLEEFADKHGLSIEVRERAIDNSGLATKRFYADFMPSAEVKEGGVLRSSYGNGSIITEAIMNLIENVRLKTIVIGAYKAERREIEVPYLEVDDESLCNLYQQ
jgi:hypothetical protein